MALLECVRPDETTRENQKNDIQSPKRAMNPLQNKQRFSTTQTLALFCAGLLVLLLSMQARLGVELADDGAFFLRYAQNMLRGEFWVWNAGEPPVWGASAPLYPLLLAAIMKLGISPEASIVAVGFALCSVSLTAVSMTLAQRFGTLAGLAFLALAAFDTGLMYFAGSGLESPLTVALLSFALWALLRGRKDWQVGLAAGLLMVNKLDLVPAGALLLLAFWHQEKRMPKIAIAVAAGIAIGWYVFAWWYFGAPVPNSFLTKSLHQEDQPKIITWTWFGELVFWLGIHKWLTAFAVFAALRRARLLAPELIFLGGLMLVHLAAYTIKYPFEPYNWYGMPALFALLVVAAIGISQLGELVAQVGKRKAWLAPAVVFFTLLLAFKTSIRTETLGTANIKMFTSHHELDRAEAGRWVAANTPAEFSVYTMWGNPAYYSNRVVLDGSFLNRRFESSDLISKYRPEILILQNNPGSTPMNPVFAQTKGEGYRVVKVFAKTYAAGMDYFFAVLAREDVLNRIAEIDTPRDLMPYVKDVKLGDVSGIVKPQGVSTLFVHPGATTATEFSINGASYLHESGKSELEIHARMAPNVPEDAIKRGGANVRVQFTQGDKVLADSLVKVGSPMRRTFTVTGSEPLRVIVGNNGSPDTDWLLFSVH